MFTVAASSVTSGRTGDELSSRACTVTDASSVRMHRVSTLNRRVALVCSECVRYRWSQLRSLPKPTSLRPTNTTRAPGQSLTGSATLVNGTLPQQRVVGGGSVLWQPAAGSQVSALQASGGATAN